MTEAVETRAAHPNSRELNLRLPGYVSELISKQGIYGVFHQNNSVAHW